MFPHVSSQLRTCPGLCFSSRRFLLLPLSLPESDGRAEGEPHSPLLPENAP